MTADHTLPVQAFPTEIKVGSELGSYRLVSVLGEGAMGRVFRASHLKLGREVAIKVLNPEYVARPDVVKRFFREARVVNQINHEHIVEVTDFVEQSGCAFLVMELLEGQSLREIMKGRKARWPSVKRSIGIMAQVCDAIAAAHANGVVHRDLKPDNIFVIERSGRDYAKVLDFGVAKLQEPIEGDSATKSTAGLIIGTPLYMAPEQATGQKVDGHTDVWSAGVVLYELLSGEVPFRGPSFVDLANKLRNDPAKPLPPKTPRGETIPPALVATVLRCLEKRPADRWRSMTLLADMLRSVGGSVKQPSVFPIRWVAAVGMLALGVGAAAHFDLPRRAGSEVRRRYSALASKFRTSKPQPPPTPPAEPSDPPPVERTENPSATAPVAGSPSHAELHRPPHAHPLVEIELYSSPSGATVVRLDTGEVLGKTPARLKVARKGGDIALRFKLDGYRSITASVDLETGGSASVAMRPIVHHKTPVKKSGKKSSRTRRSR